MDDKSGHFCSERSTHQREKKENQARPDPAKVKNADGERVTRRKIFPDESPPTTKKARQSGRAQRVI